MDAEKAVLKDIEKQYQAALKDIDTKIRILESDELTQTRIYRIEYQKALKKQVEATLEKLHSDEYSTINQFLSGSYTNAFIGTMYDLHGQNIPLVIPVDKNAAAKAIVSDTKLSKDLYTSLGVDITKMKKTISGEITRGIASGLTHYEIARNISFASKAPMSRAKTIAQTESHRIQQASTHDAQKAAKAKGADIVKQWDSTLDGKTRDTHRKLDGQIREIDEYFEMDGKKARYPGDFGDPAEDCNCRCVSLQRARKAMDADELNTLKQRAEYFGLDKSDSFVEFKNNYLKAVETVEKSVKSGIIDTNTFSGKIGLQFFALPKETNDKKVSAFKKELAAGNINLKVRFNKQSEHVAGTKGRERRIALDASKGKVSTYFYEGTDVEALLSGVCGTGKITFDSESSIYPIEYISFDHPIGMAYNYGEQKYVDVKRIAVHYSNTGIHAYPVKDW